MRKFLISAALISATAVTMPATAQPRYGHGYNQGGAGIQRQLDQLVDRIRRDDQRGRLSRSEARKLYNRADRVHDRLIRFQRNGLSVHERRELQEDIRDLRERLREDRRDGRRDDRRW